MKRYTWQDYEYAKQEWVNRHPRATPQEYEAAMARIARRMGL